MLTQTESHITLLPNEILQLILGLLDGPSLARCSRISQRFNTLVRSDGLWGQTVSSLHLSSPAPYESFKELYAALHHHLWLHGQVWYGDRRFTGYFVIARYSAISGAIEIYNLLVNQNDSKIAGKPWSRDPTALVVDFDPYIRFWRDPVLVLTKDTPYNESQEMQPPPRRGRELIYCSLSRTTVMPPKQDHFMPVWPPTIIPSGERTRSISAQGFRVDGHQPQTTNKAAESLFRLRTWMIFGANSNHLETRVQPPAMGNGVETFSALDKSLYTPDKEHPLRGLWVGDYTENGCEIVLFHQPTPERLEGIKITGDINVPRGEYTFIIENLKEPTRIADEVEWPGATVVKGKTQIASIQFTNVSFIPSEMIIISPDEVACYWAVEVGGDITRFKRLNIDKFIYGTDAIMFDE